MAKPNQKKKVVQQPKKARSKAKSTKRVQNAFEIAAAEERYQNGGDSDSDDGNGAIVNARKRFNKGSDDESDGDNEFIDEEIDSDEALGSDDDFDVMNSKFSQTLRDKAKAKKKGEYQSDDDIDSDEAEQSVDEGDFLPLSAVWDLDDKDLKKSQKKNKDVVLDDNWDTESSQDESESESESESDDDDQVEDFFPFEDEEDEDEDVELTTLKNSLQKKEKRAKKQYEDLQIEENELALPGGGNEITLTDMLSIVDQESSKKAILIDKEETETSGKPLAIPLPKRIQQRHDRKAAYQISKDEVNKWKDTVKQNRESEVLSFPMNPTVEHNAVSTFASTTALTELEKKVNGLLTESALLDEKQESTFEEIKTAKMSPAELQKRTAELRKMRELMFRQERESKRLKKIKSKSFRRIKKKELLKNQEMMGDDESDDDEHDRKRAEERMSLKHKNNAFARSLVKSGMSNDAESREEMEAMLRRGERLKSKILDREDGDDEFNDMNNMDIGDESEEIVDDEQLEKVGKTGVLNMAFMKKADARQRTENAQMRDNLRKLESTGDIEEFEDREEQQASAVNVSINPGRRVYTPGALEADSSMKDINREVLEEYEMDQETTLSNRMDKSHKKQSILERNASSTEKVEKDQAEQKETEELNPWTVVGDHQVQKSRKIKVVDRDSSKMEKTAAKLDKKKQQKKRKNNEMDDADEILEMNDVFKVIDPHGDDNDEGSEDEDPGKLRMFKQTDLMKQAFAGDDDLIADFEAEKQQVIRDEGDQVEDLTLPGWGDWVGGKNKPKKNKVVKKTKGIDASKRRDKNLKGVIINEKVNKKNAKYQSSAVPFPYENREQYERSLRMPIGQEWTSRETHQRLTMPKVIAKAGVVIDPLKAPFK